MVACPLRHIYVVPRHAPDPFHCVQNEASTNLQQAVPRVLLLVKLRVLPCT